MPDLTVAGVTSGNMDPVSDFWFPANVEHVLA
jgi:hypothetical protein